MASKDGSLPLWIAFALSVLALDAFAVTAGTPGIWFAVVSGLAAIALTVLGLRRLSVGHAVA